MAGDTVVLLEPIDPVGIELLSQTCRVIELTGPADERRDDALRDADALIVRSTRVGDDLMALAPGLRVIGRHGAGLDNIDMDAAARRGIIVVNTPRSNTDSVAEYVIAVTLMMIKRLTAASGALRAGEFTAGQGSLPGQVVRAGLSGREIAGMRLGLVGAGAIGRAVASRASALGMVVSAYDPFLTAEQITEAGMAPVESLDALLACSEVLSLHIPGGGENTGLIGARSFTLMPAGSYLINAARGDLVVADDLAHALTTEHLAGAAVDVFSPEPPDLQSPLMVAPNFVATPHMAAMTEEALQRMALDVASNVVAAL